MGLNFATKSLLQKFNFLTMEYLEAYQTASKLPTKNPNETRSKIRKTIRTLLRTAVKWSVRCKPGGIEIWADSAAIFFPNVFEAKKRRILMVSV